MADSLTASTAEQTSLGPSSSGLLSSGQAKTHHHLSCYHCGLAVNTPDEFTLELQQRLEHFCCAGCQGVAAMIHQGGLDQFYRYRSALNKRPEPIEKDFTAFDNDGIQASFVTAENEASKTANLLLAGITCAACVWLIEKVLGTIEGVEAVRVSAASHQCWVQWNPQQVSLSRIMQSLADIGYRPQPFTHQQQQQQQTQEQRQMLFRLGFAGFAMMQVSMVAVVLYAGDIQGIDDQWVQLFRWLSLLVATPVVLFSARPFWSSAWRSLRNFFVLRHGGLSMDVPVSLAILLAYFASAWATISASGEVYFDSIAMFTFFLLLGRYMEFRLRKRNQHAAGAMSQLLPLTAVRMQAENGATETVAVSQLEPGDKLRIRSGETIPCDGVVIEGVSDIIESVLTGESKALEKTIGDEVIAGSVNTDGSLVIEVTACGENTRLSKINQLATSALEDKPRLQILADKVASYFVLGVLLVASMVFISWWHIDRASALWVTLSVLVVTCPCALSLATPTALTAANAAMGRLGLLVLKGHVVEGLPKITKIIFDKTGTLTTGQPVLNQVVLIDPSQDKNRLLSIAATMEAGSSHPLANAFDRFANPTIHVANIQLITANGVSGEYEGRVYRLGKPTFALPAGDVVKPPLSQGTWLLLSADRQGLAWIEVIDEARQGARELMQDLKQRGLALEIVSGDANAATQALALSLDIPYKAEHTPEDKLAYVQQQQATDCIMMVGDGINDVPVLAGADISLAMNSATDFARVSADSYLLKDDLRVLPAIIHLAQKTRVIIRQNLCWALAYNLLVLPLAALGYIPPYLAAVGMSLSSLVVLANALRLYKRC